MNTGIDVSIPSFQRPLSVVFGVGVLATVAAGCLYPAALLPGYRFAVFACLAPAVGSMLFLLIYRLTGGRWGVELAPFLTAGARLAPWIWLLVFPLVFYRAELPPVWPGYDSVGMVAVRAVIYAVIFFLVARLLTGGYRGQPASWVGPPGLIVMVFTLHLLAQDWLEPDFYSTAFPLVWMSGLAVTGLACAILGTLASGRSSSPQEEALRSPVGIDCGNLLLAAMLFWCYVAFAQFLIIWAGNQPKEISWYIHRTAGEWSLVPPLLAVVHFVVPFGVLLSRSNKRSPRMLAGAAVLLLFAQTIYLAWVVLPVFAPSSTVTAGALFTTGVSVMARRYLAAGGRVVESTSV